MERSISDSNIDALNSLDAAEALGHVAGRQHWPIDSRLRTQELRQRQGFDLARRHGRFFGDLLAEWRKKLLADTDQSRWGKDNETDEDQPEPQQPVLGVNAENLAEQNEEQRTQCRAEEAAHAADHDHRQQFSRERDRDRVRRRHAVFVEEQNARKSGQCGGQDECN